MNTACTLTGRRCQNVDLRTILFVDPITQVLLAALLGVVVGGGAVLAWHVSDRQQHRVPDVEAPPVAPDMAAVLSVLRSSVVLVGGDDTVLKASAPAYAYGLVRGDRVADHRLSELVSKVRQDGQIREVELEMERPGRSSRTVIARVAPLGVQQVLVLVEDRTRERRVEAVRRDFVANVSHELKTPVGALRVLAEAVGDAADDSLAVKHFSERMLTEADRLASLVQRIIELSRLQEDHPVDRPDPVDVDDVVAAALDTTAIDAAARGVTLTTTGDRGRWISGDRDQVAVAAGNLLANAVAYSAQDTCVVVAVTSTEESVDIAVTDQGIGIPSGDVDRVFERFYRVDPSRRRTTGGTGLGLSIVKHVAATHGGDVAVWSVEGHGSTFTLSLPRHHPEAECQEATT